MAEVFIFISNNQHFLFFVILWIVTVIIGSTIIKNMMNRMDTLELEAVKSASRIGSFQATIVRMQTTIDTQQQCPPVFGVIHFLLNSA